MLEFVPLYFVKQRKSCLNFSNGHCQIKKESYSEMFVIFLSEIINTIQEFLLNSDFTELSVFISAQLLCTTKSNFKQHWCVCFKFLAVMNDI